jgi:hypothetical protein
MLTARSLIALTRTLTAVLSRSFLLVLVGVSLVAVVSTTARAERGWNRLAANRLSSNKLAANKLASNKLSANKLAANQLASGTLAATPSDLLTTADGRLVYWYIVSCAAPDGTTLEAVVPGAPDSSPGGTIDTPYTCVSGTCDFPGQLGLVPNWLTKKLNGKGKGWISACVLARCNAHDTAEEISLRGANPVLTISPDEALLFTLEEGAFYGNLFTPDTQPLIWIACSGEDNVAGVGGGLTIRACARPAACSSTLPCPTDATGAVGTCVAGQCMSAAGDPMTQCGFTYAGNCANYMPALSLPFACEDNDEDPTALGLYDECHSTPALGHWTHSKTYRQVITTYTSP